MSRGLPVPLRPVRPEVVVVDDPAAPHDRRARALARMAVNLTPDVLEALDRALTQRRLHGERQQPQLHATVARDERTHTRAVQYSEVEIQTWDPFPRRVTMRTTTEWATSAPTAEPIAPGLEDSSSLLRRTGLRVLGVGGALALATLGVLANRGGRLRRR